MNTTAWKLLPCLLLVPALAACGSDGEAAGGAGAPAEVPVNVRTLALEPASLPEYVAISGPLRPIRGTDVSTEESGVVASIPRDKGAEVRGGQSLVRLNRDLLAAEMEAAAAGRTLAEHNESRMRQLFESALEANDGADG